MRDPLLDTAIDHFGRKGFEGAGTRAIAEESGTAMSSITYHFGGKEGLYLAAAEHIAAAIHESFADRLAELADGRAMDGQEAAERFVALLDRFAQMMLEPRTESWSRFIIREQQQPTEAFRRLFDGAMKPMLDAFVRLAGTARPDLDEREVRATSMLLLGQALILRAGRASLCRALDIEQIDEDAAVLMRDRLAANVRCILLDRKREDQDS